MAPAMLCAALEIALNRYLNLEPAALADCERLSGSSIELHLSGFEWRLFIEFDARGVRVLNEHNGLASVTVSGAPPAFAKLALSRDGSAALPAGLAVSGDAEVLQRFRRLLGRVGFDFEEWIAPLLGDGAAHRAAQGLKSLFGWARRSADTLALDTAEYLREETRDLARGVDVEDWMNDVDKLRERIDRFEARLRAAEQRRS